MSYRELSMIEVKEVLRRREAGQALREIARETGLDRKTVRRYVEAAGETDGEVDTEVVVQQVVQRVDKHTHIRIPFFARACAGNRKISHSMPCPTCVRLEPP